MKKTRNPKTSLRKAPKQKRSKDLVSSVVEAATRVLEKVGIDHLTTNKVAEIAGVSIGSLYQYFPNKDAIFAKLIEQQMEENARRFQKAIDENSAQGFPFVIEALVSEVVTLFYEKRVFISVLFAEVPRLKKTRGVLYRRNRMLQIFTKYLETQKELLREPEQINETVYVMAHSVAGVLQTAVLENFESYPPPILQRHLVHLIKSFLLKT